MKVLVINPNTTQSMTKKIAVAAQAVARPDTKIIAANSQNGPASMVATKFSVITTLSRSVPGREGNLMRYGLAQKCGRVRATDILVLKLEEGDGETLMTIRAEIRKAITEDRAEAIVLGCAGMANLMAQLNDEFGLPVIDGVAAGVSFAEALVNNQQITSKIGAYATR